MINLDDLKSRNALSLLESYEGRNPYLKKMKKDYLKSNKKKSFSDNQLKYIRKFHDKEPQLINKVVAISPYLGEELKKNHDLSFTPERILIEFMLADTEKTYHVYGKLKRNQKKSKMYWIPKTQVMDDPYFEDIDVEVDFDKWVEKDKLGRTPYEHQKGGIKFLLSRNGCILADDMGLGKCEFVENKVFTPNGRQKIGTIKAGDYVIGSNGKPTLVEAVYPQGVKDLYRITFNDGYSVLVSKDHLFTVTSNNGSTNNKNRSVRYTTLSVEQMLDENLILEQVGAGWNEKRPYKFKTYYKQYNGQSKWQIPIVKPIEFNNNNELPINPYLLGVSLGDGYIDSTGSIKIELHKDDFDEIFEGQILNEGKPQKNKRINSITLLKEEIISLGLNGKKSYNKFIPDIYKYSSIENRVALLQGLMDTDGHCVKSDKDVFIGTEFCTVSEQLADDVAEIVHSLGGIVRKKSKIGSYKKPDGVKVECEKCYRLNIKMPEDITPFRLKRKANEYNPPQKYKVGRYIKDIQLERQGEAVCIQVAAKDHLYVTEHGIVTHNTYQAILAALESGAERILIVCPSAVKINWEREINNFDDNTVIVSGRNWQRDKFTIINYDILKNFHTLGNGKKKGEMLVEFSRELVNSKFDLCIIDEAHYLKNHKSIRGKVMVDLCVKHGIEKVWLLTGTPIANRPMDYYNLLKLIKAPIADNWKFFAQRYCDARNFKKKIRGRYKQIWITDGASNLEELSIKTRNIILRRKKEEVLDMPDKTISPVYQELSRTGRREYENLWDDYLEERRAQKKRGRPDRDLVELILLRKFIAMEAISYTIEMAEDAINQGQKVIIFTNFTDELEELMEHFGNKAVCHYGPLSDKEKQWAVDEFQNNSKVKVFVGNIRSAGVGITLTAANLVIFNSFDWVPGNNEQAEDRCIFAGQWILTKDGYSKIEDINIGDMVYTHEGNFKKVIDKHTHLERKKLRYDINAFGFNKDLSVTHDHELYVYDNEANCFKWLEAKDINILKHSLTMKSKEQPTERKEYLTVNTYVENTFKNNHKVKQNNGRLNTLPHYVELTDDLLYAFGFFIADGWASIKDNKSSTINVCQKINNPKMYDAAEYIINIFKNSFGISEHSSYIDKNNTKSCTIHSKNLALNFIEWFGHNVYTKQLPDWVDELNVEQLKVLLDGYYHGDGYLRNNTQQATTSSLKLISQLIRYNLNLGRSVSLSNKGLNNYTIDYSLDGVENKRINKIDDYMIYPIKSINISKPKRGEERVYDISVEDDHSFVVGNYNVHNCYRIGQKNNVTVYYQLFKDTISTKMWWVLQKKKDIISTIIGEKEFDDKEVEWRIIDEVLLEDEDDE